MHTRSERRAGLLTLLTVSIVLAACTTSTSDPTRPTVADEAPTGSSDSSATLAPPPEVDIGVDLESGVIRLAVVGDVEGDLWEGHFTYWNSVNIDLGGVGGRYEVELVRIDTIADAKEVGALAISLDTGPDPGVVLDMLVAQPMGLVPRGGRLPDLIGVSLEASLDAARVSFSDAEVWGTPEEIGVAGELLVTSPEMTCPNFVARVQIDAVELGSIPTAEEPHRYYLCVGTDQVLTAAGEALSASPGSVIVVPGTSWRPELADRLDGSTVVIAGYVPEPGTDGAPASDVMALLLGAPPWTGDLVKGYTTALSMHAVLEAALTDGNLSRESVREIVPSVIGADLGFGPGGVPVGILDTDSPTGVRIVTLSSTEFPLR